MNPLSESLIANSKSAIISCVELHNKPIFNYRYETCTILIINGWELLLKAFINENCPDVKLIRKDGTTKPFEECIGCIASYLGPGFRTIEENLQALYEYRCNIIHFYKDDISHILFSLIHKSILLYNDFLKSSFNEDLSEETNLFILPIGFKAYASPVDFLKKNDSSLAVSSAVGEFIRRRVCSIERLVQEGIDDSIFSNFNMSLINETRIKNADIIVGITSNPSEAKVKVENVLRGKDIVTDDDAQKIKIEEESLFKTLYTISYPEVAKKCRELFSDFLQNARFNRIIGSLKNNPKYHKKRYLDIEKQNGVGKDYYTSAIFDELSKHYTKL